jgi:hypothetical protein
VTATDDLVRGAIPLRWLASYWCFSGAPWFLISAAALTLPVLLGGLGSGVGVIDSSALIADLGGGVLLGLGIGGVIAIPFTWLLRRQVRAALAGSDAADVRLAAAAYLQTKGKYRRRPPGTLLVTAKELHFVPKYPKDAEHAFAWDLASIDQAQPTGDRFGFVSRILDLQGAVELTRDGEGTTLSVVGCHAFHQAFGELWGTRLHEAEG